MVLLLESEPSLAALPTGRREKLVSRGIKLETTRLAEYRDQFFAERHILWCLVLELCGNSAQTSEGVRPAGALDGSQRAVRS
jgi:hypothetical protein